jgi:hypothetical protein
VRYCQAEQRGKKETLEWEKGKDTLWIAVLSGICLLLIWHVIRWHVSGMYLKMFRWLGTDKGYLTVLYNIGLMLVLGGSLGFLMEKITDLLGHEVKGIRHFNGENETDRSR